MARKKSEGLVTEYLEKLSGDLLEDKYRADVAKIIRGHAGIYALYKGDNLYYVGLASNLMSRVRQHLKDRHSGYWDKFSVYLVRDDDHIKALESLMLRIISPKGNRVKGKLPGAVDRKRKLHADMTAADSTRRAELLGGQIKRNKVRKVTAAKKGSRVLEGLVSKRIQLKSEYKGATYKAALLKSGHISYGGSNYDSPTAAAKAIVSHNVNGWHFWKYKNGSKGWVKLRFLKK
jgi:hypothetical protein